MDNKLAVNIINTNARSLRPKLPSFIACFMNLTLCLAVVTETWFASGNRLELESENLLLGHGLSMKCLNRQPTINGLSHGGVAIIYRDSWARGKIYSFNNPESFEVLPLRLDFADVNRPMFVIGAYIPPGYTVAKGRACLQHINDLVLDIKNRHQDPYILVAGDFNQWEIDQALIDYQDLVEVETPPTRGDRNIDRMFTNWADDITDAGCIPPLETELEGPAKTFSDHNIQYACARLPKREKRAWEVFTYRPYTDKGAAAMKRDLEVQDWGIVTSCHGSNAKAIAYQSIVEDLMNKNFPLKTVRRREGDLPWFNNKAKKMTRKKQAVYKAEGKSDRWLRLQEGLDRYLDKRKEGFLGAQREKFTGPEASTQFYKNVKSFKNAEKPREFDVRDLRPGRTDKEVADEVAEYFNRISREFSPLEAWQIPMTYHRDLPRLTTSDVEKMLQSAKKTKSMVQGDIYPAMINDIACLISLPVADIYNSVLKDFVWPAVWKREFVTTIPKKNIPEGLSDLRNISCTLFVSKVFEAFVLEHVKEEVSLKANQFGGVKGCSTTHMVVEILQEICTNAEDYRSATVLTAIDYAKAFNRVSFQHCLEAFRRKGASTPIIRLLASFLTNRTMTVQVGEQWSEPLPVQGGCPQGSVLGVFLFNTTTDTLEDDFVRSDRARLGLGNPAPPMEQASDSLVATVSGVATSSPLERVSVLPHAEVSPVQRGGFWMDDLNIQFQPNVVNIPVPEASLITPPREVKVGTQVLEEKPVKVFKYIDDNLICEKINFGTCPLVPPNSPGEMPSKIKQALPSQNAFRSITTNAEKIGMVVNNNKTVLLCISDALNYKPSTYIIDNSGNRIDCVDKMKILGFTFSSKPTVTAHVETIAKRMRQKYWSLRHLRGVGFNSQELVEVYKSVLLPIADYCAPAYHSLMTDLHDQLLEQAQTGALRAIFGYGPSARSLRQQAGIETLRARRVALTDKFAEKCVSNPRFCHWFPLKTGRVSSRTGEKYQETRAKTDRLNNQTLHSFRASKSTNILFCTSKKLPIVGIFGCKVEIRFDTMRAVRK